MILKQEGLDRLLVYDRHPRKALVDHFYPIDVTLEDLAACRDVERGDFVDGRLPLEGPRDAEASGTGDGTARLGRRPSDPDQQDDRAGRRLPALDVHYVLSDLPPRRLPPLRRRDEPGGDGRPRRRSLLLRSRPAAGSGCSTPGSTCRTRGLTLTDEWLDLTVGLTWSLPGGLWCFPIETVSQSEGGFEGVYQVSAVIPHWHVTADETGRWAVKVRLALSILPPSRGATAPAP